MTFHFEASLPAHRAFLDPLREILRQAFAYVGYPAIEASEMAGAIEALVAQGLPADLAVARCACGSNVTPPAFMSTSPRRICRSRRRRSA